MVVEVLSLSPSQLTTLTVILDDALDRNLPENIVNTAQEQCVIDMDSDDGGDAMW